MKKKIIIGNWKMYPIGLQEADNLATTFSDTQWPANASVVLCPAFPFLGTVSKIITRQPQVGLGAQNCAAYEKGAYTGEVSVDMLKNFNCTHAIVGHSERRGLFGETNESIRDKINLLQAREICPILCVGEPLEIYQQKRSFAYIEQQIKDCLPSQLDQKRIIIAYEPIWAIGSGLTPTPQEIRDFSEKLEYTLGMQLIYGGSVNADFASKLSNIEALSGLLVGGASININEFKAVVFNFCGENK